MVPEARRGCCIPQIVVSHGCWVLNLGPWQEQKVLLTSDHLSSSSSCKLKNSRAQIGRITSIKGPSVASFVLTVESSPCCKTGRLFADNLCYQIPTQASAQLYIVNIHGNMSSYKVSKDAEVWIVKDEMDGFHIFIADCSFFFFSNC